MQGFAFARKAPMLNKFYAGPELGKMANYEAKRVKNCARRQMVDTEARRLASSADISLEINGHSRLHLT